MYWKLIVVLSLQDWQRNTHSPGGDTVTTHQDPDQSELVSVPEHMALVDLPYVSRNGSSPSDGASTTQQDNTTVWERRGSDVISSFNMMIFLLSFLQSLRD